ncbi:MAG: hypothetical protein WCQ57_08180 [Verrucomicrobiota bacterium]|jgi:hypothetical protein
MNSVELGAKERLESGSRKVSVGRCRLADPKMLHAGEAGAIRERERLVFIAQHSFLGFGKKIGTDPREVDDP